MDILIIESHSSVDLMVLILGSRMKVESLISVLGALVLLNLIYLKAFWTIIRSICPKSVDRPWGCKTNVNSSSFDHFLVYFTEYCYPWGRSTDFQDMEVKVIQIAF